MIILNKKYALRKIGKYFGPCIVGTVMMLGGAVIANPTVAHASVSASSTASDTNIHQIGSSNEGYEVIIPKGKKYIRNDESNNQTPKLVDPGYNGRSFIVKSDNYALFDEPSELFKKLYDKDGDGEIDEKYKNPKYPHVIDSGLTDDTDGSNNKPGVWEYKPDGRYKESDGVIDENDNMVVARKPFTINENAEDNVVNDDGSVVLTGDYKIHVNTGDHIDKKDDVYEVGTKPKVEETLVPFTTRYEKDDESPKGKETEVTPGVDGKTVTTTTYEVDPNTGKVIENPSTSVTTDPVTRVVKVGTQPKVDEIVIPFEREYEDDSTMLPSEERKVRDGVNGKLTRTTNYDVDSQTGKVTEKVTEAREEPVNELYKRGTGVTSKIPFETTEKENPNILPSESGKVLVEGEEGVLHPDGKTVIKKPVNKVVEKGTGVTTPIPKGDYKVIEDPTLPEGQEIIDNEGEDGILHPDGKTVIRERIQPVKRVGKSVTSKGGENPPVVNEEKLIVTQYVNENGETIKTIEGQIDTPENYLKDEKGNITYQLDENKPKDENGGVVKYYYKTITTSKSTDIPPVHELPELKVIIVRDETGKEIKSYIESEFNKEDLDKEYDYIKGPEDKGNGITEYIYQTKINKPKDKLEVENINKLTDREKETLKEKVKEVNPDKFITIGEDGLIRLYDKEDKTDIVQTLKISDFIFVKPKQEKVEIVEVSQSSKLKEDKPVEAKEEPKERELPNTNSASVLTSLISSTIGSLGLAFTKRKKK